MKRAFLFLSTVFVLTPLIHVAAQPANPRSGLARSFAASGLEIGSAFPEVDVYTRDGKAFNTRELKGHHTVLVTGCLT